MQLVTGLNKAAQSSGLSKTNSLLLDLVRVIAAWGVMIGHSFGYCGLTRFRDQRCFPYIQNIGVVLLIMLAGFFIAYSLDRKRKNPSYHYTHFLVDKLCRIEGAFIPAIILVAIIDKISMTVAPDVYSFYEAYNLKTFIGNLFQLQDIPKAGVFVTSFASARPFWTLSVEWWYYMLAGYVVLLLYPKIRERQVRSWHILLLPILAYPSILHLIGGRGNGLTFTFGLGIIIYCLHEKIRGRGILLLALAVASFIATVICGMYFKEAYCVPFVLCVAMTILFAVACGSTMELKVNEKTKKVISFFASYTFSLYLIHYSILDLLARGYAASLTPWGRFFIGILLSNAIAIPFSMVFERGSKKLAAKIAQKRAKKEMETSV